METDTTGVRDALATDALIEATPWRAVLGGVIVCRGATRDETMAAVTALSRTGFATVRNVLTRETWLRPKNGAHWLCHSRARLGERHAEIA